MVNFAFRRYYEILDHWPSLALAHFLRGNAVFSQSCYSDRVLDDSRLTVSWSLTVSWAHRQFPECCCRRRYWFLAGDRNLRRRASTWPYAVWPQRRRLEEAGQTLARDSPVGECGLRATTDRKGGRRGSKGHRGNFCPANGSRLQLYLLF